MYFFISNVYSFEIKNIKKKFKVNPLTINLSQEGEWKLINHKHKNVYNAPFDTYYLVKLKNVTSVLQQKLEDSNLTNAKLLYQNKALHSDSLNERQKSKLVEAVSNAETTEEAKVIFETLESTVGSTSRKKKQPQSLREAVERSSSMILSNRKRDTVRQKANPTYDRWKSLAGIKPS